MSGIEIIGVVAAAEQFAEVVFKTIKLAKSVANQIQDGPGQIQQNIERLESLASLAKRIQNTKSLQTEDVDKILIRCECHMQSLQDLLQKISFESHDSMKKKTWRAIIGLKEEGDISKLFGILDQEYILLNTQISLCTLAVAEDAQGRNRSVDTRLNTMAQAARAADSSFDPLQCLQALFITEPEMDRAKLITSKGELVQGTCDWVTQKVEFTEWQASDGGLLWISGGPGLGKTMLSIHLTEFLSRCFHSLDQSYYSTYFFCDAKDNTRNNAVAIVRGILFQLLKQKGDLIEHIMSSYRVQREQLFQPDSFEALWGIFLNMTSALRDSQVYCILDGLDECEPNSLEPLLTKLSKITSTSPRMKVIILSREYPRCLEASLGQFPRIRLDPDAKTEISEGLDLYISTRVAELSKNKQYPPELTKSVEKTLKEKSMGTYLWASFVIKDLHTMEISGVEESLRQLPRGLNALYERILEQIEPDHRDLTLDILRWCTFAVSPLELEELAGALRIQPTEWLDSTAVLRGKLIYCGNFINITDNVATLVHQSAHDFLTGRMSDSGAVPWFSLSNVELEHSRLASSCIVCIDDLYDGYTRCVRGTSPLPMNWVNPLKFFSRYALRHWGKHFSYGGQHSSRLLDKYPQFFSSESRIWKDWSFLMPFRTHFNGVASLAALFGLSDLLQQRLKEGGILLYLKDLFAGLKGLTLIHLASMNGQLPIVEMLIKNKVRINSKDKDGNTPLYYAAQRGHLAVVKTLLTNGARINRCHEGRTPFFAAVRYNHHETAEYLLMSGANDDGILPAIRLLLDPKWGLDLNIRDRNGVTALCLAVGYRSVEAVELLLAQTARVDPTLVNNLGLSPIHAALLRPQMAIVRRLLEESNVSLPEPTRNCRWSPIHLLTISSNELEERVKEALQFLVEELGVDPQLRTPKPRRIDATWHSHHYISLYLRTRTEWSERYLRGEPFNLSPWLNPPDFCYETPLSLAIRGGYVSTVEYFLENCQIDPSSPCRGCDGASPLHVAAQSLRDDVVDILISKWKADVHCVDKYQRTPLHAVADALSPAELGLDSFKSRCENLCKGYQRADSS
ncbi:ankyrin repeat-containing domain protein [Trichoderma afarasin]